LALEYTWEADIAFSREQLREHFAERLAGADEADAGGFTVLSTTDIDLNLMVIDPADPDRDEAYEQRIGFTPRVAVRFRLHVRSEQSKLDASRTMYSSVIAFAREHPCNGILLWNGEYVVLEHHGDDIALNSEWDDVFDEPYYAAVLAGLPRRPLAQPWTFGT
jgi:hypothetical protein